MGLKKDFESNSSSTQRLFISNFSGTSQVVAAYTVYSKVPSKCPWVCKLMLESQFRVTLTTIDGRWAHAALLVIASSGTYIARDRYFSACETQSSFSISSKEFMSQSLQLIVIE